MCQRIRGGVTGDVACDQYHLYPQDIALAKRLNQKSQRFSISWPRIQPAGTGASNMKGIDHYSRFVDARICGEPPRRIEGCSNKVTTISWWPSRATPAPTVSKQGRSLSQPN
jgi:hypothetical protein